MRTLIAMLIGVVLGAGLTALTARAQWCCAQFDVPLNSQLEMEHAAGVQQEMAQEIPLPRWTPPSLPCDR